MKTFSKFLTLIFTSLPLLISAQVKNLPKDSNPIDFLGEPWNILAYLLLPILLVLFYLWWKKVYLKKRNEEKEG